jgi:23S rRNA (adenine2503-C2)-methyltransferase
MKYKYGNSICVSSQAGCRMGCKFCASGMDGLVRDLTPGEIIGQILAAEKDTGERINHVVVMGTGEPFDNYDSLAGFLRLLHDPNGLNLSLRNII